VHTAQYDRRAMIIYTDRRTHRYRHSGGSQIPQRAAPRGATINHNIKGHSIETDERRGRNNVLNHRVRS